MLKKNLTWFRSANFNNYESQGHAWIHSRQKERMLKYPNILYFNYLLHWETSFETISSVLGIKSSLGRRMKFVHITNSLCIKSGVVGCYVMAC